MSTNPITTDYVTALDWAATLHASQFRKGTTVPYVSHLLRVSATVWEYGGDTTQAIAGLLHDGPEDHGGQACLDEIARLFGPEVAGIVEDCSDSLVDTDAGQEKQDWQLRKEHHLQHLAEVSNQVALVVVADKLDNLESIVRDVDTVGLTAVMARFNAGGDSQVWFYRSVADVLRSKVSPVLMRRYDEALQRLASQVESGERS